MDYWWTFVIGKLVNKHLWEMALLIYLCRQIYCEMLSNDLKGTDFILRLTPEIELDILLSCPDADENNIFRGPGPTSIMLLLGEPMVETWWVLLYPGQKLVNIEMIKIHQFNQILISTIVILKFQVPLSFFFILFYWVV